MAKNVLHETKGSLLKCKELLLEWMLLLELILSSLHLSSSVVAECDQLVNICSFAVRCDRRWPSTQ